jgi:hypothetical protein
MVMKREMVIASLFSHPHARIQRICHLRSSFCIAAVKMAEKATLLVYIQTQLEPKVSAILPGHSAVLWEEQQKCLQTIRGITKKPVLPQP